VAFPHRHAVVAEEVEPEAVPVWYTVVLHLWIDSNAEPTESHVR
jgi:hypothetical protein